MSSEVFQGEVVELTVVALIILQLNAKGELSVGYLGCDADSVVGQLGHVDSLVIGEKRGPLVDDVAAGANGETVLAVRQA